MTDGTISPPRRRMIDDMALRGFSAGTQRGYVGAVAAFAAFLGRPPDRPDVEDLRRPGPRLGPFSAFRFSCSRAWQS